MDLGWRAEEAFTSGANRADGKNSTGILEEGIAEQEVMGKEKEVRKLKNNKKSPNNSGLLFSTIC